MDLLTKDSLRIAHVEHDNDFAQLIEVYLKRAGFKQPIAHWNEGIGALNYFSQLGPEHAPHVILLNLHIPHMKGLEVLHWLRHNYNERDVAVYLLTSLDDPEGLRQVVAGRITQYLFTTRLFDELSRNLDYLIAIINDQRLEDPSTRCANRSRFLIKPPNTEITRTKKLTISYSVGPQ